MSVVTDNTNFAKNTTYKVVLPFYVYATLSFLVACSLLFNSSAAFTQHYFQPRLLSITHIMSLGWGTMMILGASYQLIPVLTEGKLYSNLLAYLSFGFAASGIPLLVYAFYTFNMGYAALCGGILVNAAIVLYLVNLVLSISKSKNKNVHAIFVLTAGLWLLLTTMIGLLLLLNFSVTILPKDSLYYLSLHAHIGFVGWFLMLIVGVGSRLIPMFLISKYSNTKLLWLIYALMNGALISFISLNVFLHQTLAYLLSIAGIIIALLLYGFYCYQSFSKRIRKHIDPQMRISLLSVMMMILPVIFLMLIIVWMLLYVPQPKLVVVYGFSIFFGWITAIILGMTFKTLPFIIWNKHYHDKAGSSKTPNPKDLFSRTIFTVMSIAYIAGFSLFVSGILLLNIFLLQMASILLLLTALLYNWNIFKMLNHKPITP